MKADFDTLFDTFRLSTFRLETLPAYDVGQEDAPLAAFRAGRPRLERSVRTSAWMARIAVTTAQEGKQWSRLRVVDDPLTEYERYELGSYVESQAVGEQIRIVQRSEIAGETPDFWLFDAGTPDVRAVMMIYADDGRWLGYEAVDDPARVAELDDLRKRIDEHAVPLAEFLLPYTMLRPDDR